MKITLLCEAEQDFEQSYIVRFSSVQKPPLLTTERGRPDDIMPHPHVPIFWNNIKSVSIKIDKPKTYVVQELSEPPRA